MATLNLWRQDEKLAALVKKVESTLSENSSISILFCAVEKLAAKGKVTLPIGLMDVHIHDLRHNFASTAVTSGHHLKVIGSLLGHADTQTTERYAHLANDPLQTANEAISKKILDAMTIKPKAENVINLRRKG